MVVLAGYIDMGMWGNILKKIQTQRYRGTESLEGGKLNIGKKNISISAPTSYRSFSKKNGHFIEGKSAIEHDEIPNEGKTYVPRASSAISKVDYDPQSNTASVTFVGGRKSYDFDVSPEELQDFIDAPSKGRWVNEVWRKYNRKDMGGGNAPTPSAKEVAQIKEVVPPPSTPTVPMRDEKKVGMPSFLPPNQPGLDLSTSAGGDDFNESGSTIGWDDAKNILQDLSGGTNIAGTVTLNGIQTDDFNPEVHGVEGGEVGEEVDLPDSETGPTQKLFNDIMAGKVKGKDGMGGNDGGVIKKGHHSTLKGKKQGNTEKHNGLILPKLSKRRREGEKGELERVQDAIMHGYPQWPMDYNGAHVYHKGAITLYVDEFGISIKYGSHGKTPLDTFAKAHPDAMQKVSEMLGIR